MKFLVVALLFVACKISKVGKDPSTEESTRGAGSSDGVPVTPVVQPQRTVGAPPSQTLLLHVSEMGELFEKLALRLDYIPAPKPGGVTVPSCYSSIAGHLVVGRLSCINNTNIGSDIIANQVDQVCHTDNNKTRVPASQKVTLTGCSGTAGLQVFKYEPDLKIEVLP